MKSLNTIIEEELIKFDEKFFMLGDRLVSQSALNYDSISSQAYPKEIHVFIRQMAERVANEALEAVEVEKIVNIITTHTENEGDYCDTGADMDWFCRSECTKMAEKRVRNYFDKLVL